MMMSRGKLRPSGSGFAADAPPRPDIIGRRYVIIRHASAFHTSTISIAFFYIHCLQFSHKNYPWRLHVSSHCAQTFLTSACLPAPAPCPEPQCYGGTSLYSIEFHTRALHDRLREMAMKSLLCSEFALGNPSSAKRESVFLLQRKSGTKCCRRIVGTLAIAGAAYGLSRYIDIRFEIQQAEENKNKITRPNDSKPDTEDGAETGQDVDDEDDYEVLLFLPTGLSRPKPRTLYRGSDPEWQEFKRLATDAPRVQRIRSKIYSLLLC